MYADAPSFARIATLESLREHLQWAIELEHFTLPPYLCALYSLDAARNPGATEVVASVLVEEMLHMTLPHRPFAAIRRGRCPARARQVDRPRSGGGDARDAALLPCDE